MSPPKTEPKPFSFLTPAKWSSFLKAIEPHRKQLEDAFNEVANVLCSEEKYADSQGRPRVYVHHVCQNRFTVGGVPVMLGSDPEALTATGSLENTPEPLQQYVQQREPTSDGVGAGRMRGLTDKVVGEDGCNLLRVAGLCGSDDDETDENGNASSRTRTLNPLIKSQLLCQLS
jgi:hypothetical protein